MSRARGCDLRAVLAGAILCWAAVEGVAPAQEGAEVTEDLGNSYMLARRTTGQGSIIETLLFAGQAIVTEIAVPAQDAGTTAGTTGAVAATLGGTANALPTGLALPPDFGPGFGGTLLSGEIVDDYFVLHRTRASGPVAHDIFYGGRKVGSVTEVVGPSSRIGRLAGRNSFGFESTDDRFVVLLTQPDGTKIRATTEHGRFSGQVVERSATLAMQPRPGIAAPFEPLQESVGPSIGNALELQRLARPQDSGPIMAEELALPAVRQPPDTVPLPRAFPFARLRPAIRATPVQTATPPAAGNVRGRTPEAITATPIGRPKPAVTSVDASLPPATAVARPVARASAVSAPAAKPNPAMTSASPPSPATPSATRPVPPTRAGLPAVPKPAAASAAQPLAAAAAKPTVGSPGTAAPSIKQKPASASENARPSPVGPAKPITSVARPSRSPPSDPSVQ